MKWLSIAGVAVLCLVGYATFVNMKVPPQKVVITKSLVQWQSTGDSASSTWLMKDSAGRIISVENNVEVNSFRFWADSVLLTEYSKTEDRIVYTFKGRRDSSGKLISGKAIATYDVFEPDTVQHRFEYNAGGYLVKEFRDYGKTGTYIIAYEYDGSDVVKISTWLNNVLNNTKELAYYKEKNNLTGLEDFKFRRNINSLVKQITSTAGNGKRNYSFNYEYETDEDGMPVKLIAKRGKKVSTVTTYYYAAKL
jgi:YD repeat-containing protein